MIKKKSGIRGFYMQRLLLVSISGPLCCELKVSVRGTQGEIPIRVERFIATHLMRCFLKRCYACLLRSLNIKHCIALYLSSFFLIHAQYCMYGSFKEVPFEIIHLVYQSHFIHLVYQSYSVHIVHLSHFVFIFSISIILCSLSASITLRVHI